MKNKTSAAHKKNPQLIDSLAHLLADTYHLYLKTQNFHWNVRGPHFFEYHKMFEEQYQQLADATDKIAERMRALREPAPASFSKFLQLTSLAEAGHNLSAKEMLEEALADHEAIAKTIAGLFEIAEECGDEVTLDLFIERKTEHDKTAWMLRSLLEAR